MSKAGEWAKRDEAIRRAQNKIERGHGELPPFNLTQPAKKAGDRDRSLYAHVVNRAGTPECLINAYDLTITKAQALALGRWLIAMFDEPGAR